MFKRKITRRELRQEIKDSIPNDYNEYEKIAFIELKLAKHMKFNEHYYWGDDKTRERIYKLAKREAQHPKSTIKRKLICLTMSEQYGYLAQAMGYGVEFLVTNNITKNNQAGTRQLFQTLSPEVFREHVATVIEFNKERGIQVDIQADIWALQTRCRPENFGKRRDVFQTKKGVQVEKMTDAEVSAVFKRVYGLSEEEMFTDEYIKFTVEMLRKEGKKAIEILEFLMEDSRIQNELKNTRSVEAYRFYIRLVAAIYSKGYDSRSGYFLENRRRKSKIRQ